MGPNLLQALYDSLNAGKAGVKAAFAPKLGGPDAESAFKSALAGGVGAAMVPFGALDEAATGAGQYMAEDVGRAGAAVERAGMPTLGKALGVGGAALGMVPVAGSFAVDPEAGASKVAGRSVLEHLAAQNLPEAVMRKAESLQAMYGEDALGKIVKEYADKGVPLFSHDLPMDEASRMARAKAGWTAPVYRAQYEHDISPFTSGGFHSVNPSTTREYANSGIDAIYSEGGDFIDAIEEGTRIKPVASIAIEVPKNVKMQRLMDMGSDVGDVKKTYEELRKRGLMQDNTPWDSLDDEVKAQLKEEYSGKALWYMLEKEGAIDFSNRTGNVLGFKDISPITRKVDSTAYIPESISRRSPFAAFDPRMKDSRFLLALKAGAIPLAGLGAAASLEGQ